MIAAVTTSIDNLIVLAVKEQWNSKERIVWHRNILALVIQAILMNNRNMGLTLYLFVEGYSYNTVPVSSIQP